MNRKEYPTYKDSGIEWLGAMPEHWEMRRLKQVTRFEYGGSLASEDRVPGEYDVLGSNGIVGNHEQANTKGPCLVVGRKGSFGKVTWSENPCFAIDTTYFVDKTHTKNFLRWLYYCLHWLKLDAFSKDSAVPGLAREDAYQKALPYCKPEEQQAIAFFLDRETARIDALIAKKERQIELLQEKRVALISHVVTKGLDPNVRMKDSGVEWLGEIPEHWTIDRLRRLSKRVTDGAHISPDLSSEDYPFVSIVDIKNETIDFEKCLRTSAVSYEYFVKNDCRPFKNDVLFSKDGTVGHTALIDFDRDFVVASSLVIISPIPSRIESNFLRYWLNNSLLQQDVSLQMSGAALRRISVEKISRFPVVVPPLPEQEAIATHLDSETGKIDVLITKVQMAMEKLKEYRTSLISAAVTGKIDVREEVA